MLGETLPRRHLWIGMAPMEIRPLNPLDREPLAALIHRIESFSPDEIRWALKLIDLAAKPNNPEYQILVAESGGKPVGYVCYGPVAMTEGTFDLHWIASDPDVRGQGVGASLVSAMEGELRKRKGRVVRVEASATEDYGPARGFYQSMKYQEEARFKDFYHVGDDLIILKKVL